VKGTQSSRATPKGRAGFRNGKNAFHSTDLTSAGERCCTCLGDCMVLFARAATYANRTDYFSIAFQGNPAREYYDPDVIRRMNPKELATGLRVLGQIFGRDVEGSRGIRVLDRNVDASRPRAPSIRAWAIRFPPASATAIFIGWPISAALLSAAAIIFRASFKVIMMNS
jgi:hypothetical protein